MSEVIDVTPEPAKQEPQSVKIQRQFTAACSQVGEFMHRVELLKVEQMRLAEEYKEVVKQEATDKAQAEVPKE